MTTRETVAEAAATSALWDSAAMDCHLLIKTLGSDAVHINS